MADFNTEATRFRTTYKTTYKEQISYSSRLDLLLNWQLDSSALGQGLTGLQEQGELGGLQQHQKGPQGGHSRADSIMSDPSTPGTPFAMSPVLQAQRSEG